MQNPNETKKEPSKYFVYAKKIFLLLFPVFTLLKINKLLSMAEKIQKDVWFKKQKKRNLFVGFLVSIPLLVSLALSYLTLTNSVNTIKYVTVLKKQMSSFELVKATKLTYHVITNDDIKAVEIRESVSSSIKYVCIGLFLSFVFGTIVIKNMTILKDTKLLVSLLRKNGIFDHEDEKSRIALATPIGFLIDITGSNANEILHNERIWMALNLKVNDWDEDSNKRAIVFFKKAYELQKEYKYSLQDLKALK